MRWVGFLETGRLSSEKKRSGKWVSELGWVAEIPGPGHGLRPWPKAMAEGHGLGPGPDEIHEKMQKQLSSQNELPCSGKC